MKYVDALLGLLLHLPCGRRLDLGQIKYSEFASQLNFSLRGKKTYMPYMGQFLQDRKNVRFVSLKKVEPSCNQT